MRSVDDDDWDSISEKKKRKLDKNFIDDDNSDETLIED